MNIQTVEAEAAAQSADVSSNTETEQDGRSLRVVFKDPALAVTPEGLVMRGVVNGLNTVQAWVQLQRKHLLPEQFDPETTPAQMAGMEEDGDQIADICGLVDEVRVFSNQGIVSSKRVNQEVPAAALNFLDLHVKDLAGLRAFLGPGISVFIHNVKSPFTAIIGNLQLLNLSSRKISLYPRLYCIINQRIVDVGGMIEKGILDLADNLDYKNNGMNPSLILKGYHEIFNPALTSCAGELLMDSDIEKDLEVSGNDFWYRYLIGDIAKNVSNAFLSGETEDATGAEEQFQTPDGVLYADIPDDPGKADYSTIPEMLKDRSKRVCVYRVCRSVDGEHLEVRIYDNAIGYMKRIIERGFVEAEAGIHGYNSNSSNVHSQGSVMRGHADIMKKFGIEIIPAFVRDREGKVVPKAGLTIIKIPFNCKARPCEPV